MKFLMLGVNKILLMSYFQKCPPNQIPTRDGRYCIGTPLKVYDSTHYCPPTDIQGRSWQKNLFYIIENTILKQLWLPLLKHIGTFVLFCANRCLLLIMLISLQSRGPKMVNYYHFFDVLRVLLALNPHLTNQFVFLVKFFRFWISKNQTIFLMKRLKM